MLSSKNTGKGRPTADQVNRGSLFAYLRNMLLGRTNGSTPPAGQIGEYLNAGTSGVALVSGTAKTIVALLLTPGDWEVWANLEIAPASTTVVQGVFGVISNANNSLSPAEVATGFTLLSTNFTVNVDIFLPIAPCRVNVTVNTNVYLVALVNFTTSTCSGGGLIKARRMS